VIAASPGVGAKPPSDTGDVIVRPAAPDEAADLFRLISDNLETGHLLPRPLGEVVLHVPRFLVAAEPAGVVGCAELARLGSKLAEVRSLVVAATHRGHGVGTLLLNEMVEMARQHGYGKLSAFAYNPRPFVRLGFSIVPHPWVPEKISTDCHRCVWFRRCAQYAVVLDLKQKVVRV
jgi:amino-acid N-acetyltransferase